MSKILVEFEGLEDLSPAEMKASILRFTEAREQYENEGRAGLAALFNGLLIAIAEERERREMELNNFKKDFYDDDGDDEWNDDLWHDPGKLEF